MDEVGLNLALAWLLPVAVDRLHVRDLHAVVWARVHEPLGWAWVL